MDSQDSQEYWLTVHHRPGGNEYAGKKPSTAFQITRTGAEWKLNNTKIRNYDSLAAQVAELSTRPSKADLEAVVASFNTAQAKVAELEKKVAEAPVVDEQTVVTNWFKRILNKIKESLWKQ